MKSKTLVLLVVAGVCGLVASYMTSRFLASQNEKVTVWVTKQRLPAWSSIKGTDDQFEEQERPRNEVPRNTVTSLDSVRDNLLTKTLDKGEILVSDVCQERKNGGIEVNIQPGKRAVGVRTTQEAVAGGFVMPNSHVDVIHTARGGDKDVKGRTLLQNIHVLAVDLLDKRPEDRSGHVPATVTLEVFPEEAELLAAAQTSGTITFSLRALGDGQKVDPAPTPVVQAAPKEVVAEQPKPKEEVKTEPAVEKTTLTIFQGTQTIRATYTTQNGEIQTTIERNQPDSNLPSGPFVPPTKEAGTPPSGSTK
jgi:Flp pilus assembly protein CpaB